MPFGKFGKGPLLRRAVLTAALAGGLGAATAATGAAAAATHGCTLSASASTTSSMTIHTCPNIPAAPARR
jgi:hypothetical protein